MVNSCSAVNLVNGKKSYQCLGLFTCVDNWKDQYFGIGIAQKYWHLKLDAPQSANLSLYKLSSGSRQESEVYFSFTLGTVHLKLEGRIVVQTNNLTIMYFSG